MKSFKKLSISAILEGIIIALLFSSIFSNQLSAQDKQVESKITKNDGAIYIGIILANDEKGVLIETKDLGKILIPKHEIKAIEIFDGTKAMSNNELFSTRYFISSNGLPNKKGNDYLMLSLIGGEANFAVSDDFSLGISTTWCAVPIIGSAKYSIKLSDNVHLGLGTLLATMSWAKPDGFGFYGYGSLTFGDYNSNINFSAGYAVINVFGNYGGEGGAPLFSVAGMTPISKKVSFVFDSYLYTQNGFTAALLIPGLRFATSEKNSFQFGFCGAYADGTLVPFPIPMLNWMRVLN
jgi:hypothetical protein